MELWVPITLAAAFMQNLRSALQKHLTGRLSTSGAAFVGVSGMLGSADWFTAMTLENAAYVRALGQVELVFTFIASRFFFRERSTGLEIAGVLLVVAGILILLLA